MNVPHQVTTKIAKYKGITPNGLDCIVIAVDTKTLKFPKLTDKQMKPYVDLDKFYREVLFTVSKAC